MLKEIFGQKCSLIYCPYCASIKKHGKWKQLTVFESQQLSSRFHGFSLIEETCPDCETKEQIGFA